MQTASATGYRTSPLRRILRILLIGLSVGLLLLLAASPWLMYHFATRIPPDYQPVSLTSQQAKQAEDFALLTSQEVYNTVNRLQTFRVTFHQDQINQVLLLAEQELSKNPAPAWLSYFQHPQIRLSSDKIELLGTINYQNRPLVLAIPVQPSLDSKGSLRIRLLPLKLGDLPIPNFLLKNIFLEFSQKIEDAIRTARPGRNDSMATGQRETDLIADSAQYVLPYLQKLLQSKTVEVPAQFLADQDKIALIQDIEISDRNIAITLKPVEMSF